MHTILKQTKGNKSFYIRRDLEKNKHIVHIGNGIYVNTAKEHQDILPMITVADGFESKEDAEKAIEHFIQIDKIRNIESHLARGKKNRLHRVA